MILERKVWNEFTQFQPFLQQVPRSMGLVLLRVWEEALQWEHVRPELPCPNIWNHSNQHSPKTLPVGVATWDPNQ